MSRYAGEFLAQVALEHGSPGHKREVAPVLDEREAPRCKIHPASQNALDPLALGSLDEAKPKLAGQLGSRRGELALSKRGNAAGPHGKLPINLLTQSLKGQPLPAERKSRADLASKAGIAQRLRTFTGELLIKPGRGVALGQIFERNRRSQLNADRSRTMAPSGSGSTPSLLPMSM